MVLRGWAGYVIRGNLQLRQRFEHLGYDDPRGLLGPTLWKEDIGGTSIYTGEEDKRNMKLFYVACVRYLELPFDEVVRLFGDLPVDEETFDQWWSIELFDGFHDYTSELLDALSGPFHNRL